MLCAGLTFLLKEAPSRQVETVRPSNRNGAAVTTWPPGTCGCAGPHGHLTSRLWVSPSRGHTGGRLAGPGGGAGSWATLRGWPGPARRPRPLVPTGRFPRTNRRPPSADVGPVVSRFFSGSFLRRWHFAVSLTGAPGLCRAAPSDGRPGRSLSAPVPGRRWPHPRGPAPLGFLPPRGPAPRSATHPLTLSA